MRLLKIALLSVLFASPLLAQVPTPQLNLSGNVGTIGFPVLNSGTFPIPTDADYTLANTSANTSCVSCKVTSTVSLTATRKVIYPTGRFFLNVENATTGGHSITIIGPSGAGVTIPNGQTISVWNDGSGFVQIGAPSAAAGVSSLNSLTGGLTLAAGNNVTITPSGSTLTIASAGGSSGGSTRYVFWSQTGCAQGADGTTGYTYGTTTPATNATACIDAYLAANWSPTSTLILVQDGVSVSSVHGPAQGNWGIIGLGGGLAQVGVTGCTITSNVLSCTTTANQLKSGQGIILDGFPTSTFLNEVPVVISATGLSSTTFQAAFTHGNATIEAGHAEYFYGTGIIQPPNVNGDVIHNGPASSTCIVDGGGNHWMDAGWVHPGPAPARGANLTFRDFFINGNRNNNTGAGSPFGYGSFGALYTTPYCYFSGINVDSINHIQVSGVTFYQIAAYDVKLVNAGDFRVENNTFANYGMAGILIPNSEDGVHVSAPANDGVISGNYLRAANDAIAFNAAEGYVGEIRDMVASHNVYDGDATAGRVYTGSQAPPAGDADPGAHNILWDGNVGWVGNTGSTPGTGWGFQIGLEEPRGTLTETTISGIRYTNNILTVPSFLSTNDNIGTVTLDGNEWISGTCAAGLTSTCGFVTGTTVPHTINSLTLNNNKITRNPAGSAATSLVDMQSGGVNVTIGQLFINGATVTDVGGSYSSLPVIALDSGSSIGTIQFSGIGWDKFSALIPSANIAQITAIQPQVIGGNKPCATFLTIGRSGLCPGVGASNFLIASDSGEQMTEARDGALDEKLSDIVGAAGGGTPSHTLLYRFINDANTLATNWLTVGRSGYAATYAYFDPAMAIGYSDAAISRLGAAYFAFGNGTAGDFSAALKARTMTLTGALSAQTLNAQTLTLAGATALNSDVLDMVAGGSANVQMNLTNASNSTQWQFFVPGTAGYASNAPFCYYTSGPGAITTCNTNTGLQLGPGLVYGWGSAPLSNTVTPFDTGFSRTAAGTVALGNGTPGDASGTLSTRTLAVTSLNQQSANGFAGMCTMTSVTCTATIASSYASTPICIVSAQWGSAVAGLVGTCGVSGSTVTVVASSTNTLTWGFIVIGNPN